MEDCAILVTIIDLVRPPINCANVIDMGGCTQARVKQVAYEGSKPTLVWCSYRHCGCVTHVVGSSPEVSYPSSGCLYYEALQGVSELRVDRLPVVQSGNGNGKTAGHRWS